MISIMRPAAGETGKALRGIGLLSAGRFLSLTVSLVAMGLLARLLTPEDFGISTASMIVVGLSAALFDGAFAIGITQRSSVTAEYVSSAFWLSVGLSGVMVAIICFTAHPLAALLNIEHYSAIVMVSSANLLLKSAENVCVAYMRRTSRFAAIAGYQLAATVVGTGIVSLYLAWRGYGAWALVFGQLAYAALSCVASLVLSRLPLRFAFTWTLAEDTLKSSGQFAFAQLLNWSAYAGSNFVIAHMLGMRSLGLYSRSWKLLDVITSLSATPISSVLMPVFARMQNDPEKAGKALERSLSIALPFFAIVSALTVVHAEAIVRLTLGRQWLDASLIVQIFFCVLIPRCCFKITDSVAVGFGRGMAATLRQGLYAILMTGGAFLAAPFGPNWVAVSTSVAVTVLYLTSLGFASHIVGLTRIRIAQLHLRAAAIAGTVALADVSTSKLFHADHFWRGQLAGGVAALIVLGAAGLFAPKRLLGFDLANFRRKAIA